MVSLIVFSHLAGRTSGFRFVPWPDNRRDYLLSVVILVVPIAIASLASPIVRISVAAAAVAVYGIVILTRVLTVEERAALQRMIPKLA